MRQPGRPNDDRDQLAVRPARPLAAAPGPEPGQLGDLRSSLDAVGSDIHGRISELTSALERFELRQRDETSRQTTEVVRRVLAERDARLERVESAVTAAAGFIRRLKASITEALAARDNRMAEVQRAVTLASQRLDALAEGLEPLETDLDAQAEELHTRTSAAISEALDERDQRIDAIVRALQALEARVRLNQTDPSLATFKDALTTRDARLEELESAIVATTERLSALDDRITEAAATPPAPTVPAPAPAEPEPAAEPEPPPIDEELARRDERIDARIDALVRALKALESRDRDKAGENGRVADPELVQRQIEAALAGRDAKIDQVEAALTATTVRLEGLDRRLERAPANGELERVDDLQDSVGSITSRLDRLAAAVTEALALRDAQLEEVLDAFQAVQARVDEGSSPVSGAAGRRAPG